MCFVGGAEMLLLWRKLSVGGHPLVYPRRLAKLLNSTRRAGGRAAWLAGWLAGWLAESGADAAARPTVWSSASGGIALRIP